MSTPSVQPFSIDTVMVVCDGVHADVAALTGVSETLTQAGSLIVTGYLDNLRVKVEESGTTVTGSLPVFHSGTNAVALPVRETEEVLAALADQLGFPAGALRTARVFQLDIGVNLLLTRPVAEYVALMAEAPRLGRQVFGPSSVTFGRRPVQIASYDKVRELRAAGKDIPLEWEGYHVMRVEVRFRSKLQAEFGHAVYVSDLWDQGFFRQAVTKAVARFETVRLDRELGLPIAYSVAGIRDWLALKGLSAVGGLAVPLALIDGARVSEVIGSTGASRVRKWLRALSTAPDLMTTSDLAAELSAAIRASRRTEPL